MCQMKVPCICLQISAQHIIMAYFYALADCVVTGEGSVLRVTSPILTNEVSKALGRSTISDQQHRPLRSSENHILWNICSQLIWHQILTWAGARPLALGSIARCVSACVSLSRIIHVPGDRLLPQILRGLLGHRQHRDHSTNLTPKALWNYAVIYLKGFSQEVVDFYIDIYILWACPILYQILTNFKKLNIKKIVHIFDTSLYHPSGDTLLLLMYSYIHVHLYM